MPGVKGKSGRFKPGSKLSKSPVKAQNTKSNQNKSKSSPKSAAIQNEPAPAVKIDLAPEEPKPQNQNSQNDFDLTANKIMQETAADVAAEKPPQETPPEAISNQVTEVSPEQMQNWAPVAKLAYNVLGTVLAELSGFQEMNYDEKELEVLCPATNDILQKCFPELGKGLTPAQEALLFSGTVILNVHVEKVKLLFMLQAEKKKRDAELNPPPTEPAKNESTAA